MLSPVKTGRLAEARQGLLNLVQRLDQRQAASPAACVVSIQSTLVSFKILKEKTVVGVSSPGQRLLGSPSWFFL